MALRVLMGLLITVLVAGCGSNQTTSPGPSVAGAEASSVAAASPPPSSAPSPTASAISTPAPTPTATPAPTPKPTPTPWLAYRSKRYHYSIKYPPDWVVTPGSTKLPDQFDNYTDYVYAERDTVSGTVSLSLTVTYETNFAKSHYKAKLVSSNSLRITSSPAKLLIFTATRDGRKVYIQELIVAHGNEAFFLTWWSDQGHAVADKALFKRIYLGFRRI